MSYQQSWSNKPAASPTFSPAAGSHLAMAVRTAARTQPTASRGRSSGGKHNTDQVKKYFIRRAYIAGLAASTVGGSHQSRGNHGQMATAQPQSVWTRTQVQHAQNVPDLLCLSLAQPLASGTVSSATSTWLLSRPTEGLYISLLAGSGFLPTGSTALGKGVFQDVLVPASILQCHSLFGTIAARTKLNTAVLGRDVNWKTSFTCRRAVPSYFLFSTVAHTDTNFLPKVTGK